MVKTYQMKDISDNYRVNKKDVFSLPSRLIISGNSGCGKSSLAIGNFLLREEFYLRDFKPENIFIFSGSAHGGDNKLMKTIETLEIPETNLFDSWDETAASMIYDEMVENFNEAQDEGRKPDHFLFILDDLSYTNKLQKSIFLNKLYQNSRKYCGSVWTLVQKYSQLSTAARENCNGAIFFKCTNKQLELIERDFNFLHCRKFFYKMMKDNTTKRHDYIVIDLEKDKMYRNKDFMPLCTCEGEKICNGIKI
tara:strand:+ start:145 stop:897 length:753 start_codon:yes stop_codon:yes gene_type:complete